MGTLILSKMDTITSVVCPFLEIIPVCGPMISGLVKFVASEIKGYSDMDMLMAEFEKVNAKLEQYHVKQTWNSWASGAYYKPEMDISVAWNKYTVMLRSLKKANDDEERVRHKKQFSKAYANYEPATMELHKLLTAKGTTIIEPLGKLLAEHVNCHEKVIREYTVFINKLIYKGNTMNQFYYKFEDIESDARVDMQAKIAYDAASVMLDIHMQCIKSSMDYIKKDVAAQIDRTKTRTELAKEVLSILMNDYDRYDWMVVAFITKKSHHEHIKMLNSHTLSGFTEVIKEGISVAVARQVKGTHTKAALVKQTIGRCIDKSVLCHKVANKLKDCTETVEGKPVSQTYTAVHAYLREAHDNLDAKEVTDEDYDVSASPEDSSAQTPYIYRGECQRSPGVKGGKFVVLIKSDEEIMTTNPCSKLDCGGNERGSCVQVKDMFLAVCECKMPYYGQNCEESLDDYKRYLQGKILVIDSRRRLVGSRQ